MESQQTMALRNNTERKIENRGLYRLLEVNAMNEILSYASDFPGHEDDAVDLLLENIVQYASDQTLAIDIDLVYIVINRLRAAAATVVSPTQTTYFEIGSIETGGRVLNIDLADYLILPDEEMLMGQPTEDDLSLYGTFPASQSAIEALPTMIGMATSADSSSSSSWECAVCMEGMIDASEGAKQMPCKHIFHAHCIIPWLELHNSCPLCRYELPTENISDGL